MRSILFAVAAATLTITACGSDDTDSSLASTPGDARDTRALNAARAALDVRPEQVTDTGSMKRRVRELAVEALDEMDEEARAEYDRLKAVRRDVEAQALAKLNRFEEERRRRHGGNADIALSIDETD